MSGTGRLPLQTVERLQRLFGGDARVERIVGEFIAQRWGARSLFEIPEESARKILSRPAEFLKVATQAIEPELALGVGV